MLTNHFKVENKARNLLKKLTNDVFHFYSNKSCKEPNEN